MSLRVLLGKPEAEPGLVVRVHSFGNLLNFHPHLHVMATDGGFTPPYSLQVKQNHVLSHNEDQIPAKMPAAELL